MNHRFRSATVGNLVLFLAVALATALLSRPAQAANITLQGTIPTDDAVQRFDFTVATAGSIDIRSYGYAGGTTSTGTVIPRGGFDTILTLFSASGVFLSENDDGAGAATDPQTGQASDARITANLAAGNYILTLTQYDNFSIGNLAAGFGETGHPNFTADPSFASGGSCPGNMFRDISGTDGRCRNGNWALAFNNVASVTPVAAVPEPAALLFTGIGLCALLLTRVRRHQQRTKLMLGSVALAIAAVSPMPAQSNQNPDFTNVDDILRGNRTLLNITDLQVVAFSNSGLSFTQLTTSNSSMTAKPSFPATLPPDIYSPFGVKSFTGSMFNQPQAVTVTALSAVQTESNSYLVSTNIQNAGPWYSAVKAYDSSYFTAGAMADFNQDGFDDFAFGFNDGTVGIATAADVNNPWAGSNGPFKLGPLATLDKLADMTAGDFKGDGQHEIAGMSFTVVDGVQLVIYTVDPNSLAVTPASSLVFNTPLGYAMQYASIARGRFNTTTHDQLAVTFSSAQGPTIVQIVDFTNGTLTPVGGPQFTAANVTIPGGYLQLKTGKFATGNPYDQVVFHMSSESDGGRFFQLLSVNPTDLSLTAHQGVTYNPYPCASGIQVGNFDHQQATQHNPNSQVALMYCNTSTSFVMNIYSVDPQTFDLLTAPDSAVPIPGSPQSGFPAFVATDLQGRSAVLGEPTKVTLDNTKPNIISAVPPMHADYITPVGGTKPEMLNISYIPDGFNSSFSLSQTSKTKASVTGTTSWSAGVSESASASFEVGDVDAGDGIKGSAAFNAAQDFTGSSSSGNGSFKGSDFDISGVTKKGDLVLYTDSRLNIWVYPVLGQKVCPATIPNCTPDQKLPLTFQFSGPDQIVTGITSTEDSGAYWYQPPWEFGNVFSYPATTEQLTLIYPDLAATQLSNDFTFKTSPSTTKFQATWSSGADQGSTAATADNFSFDAKTTFVAAAGAKGIGDVTTKESVKVSGSYGFSNLQTNTAEMDASNGIGILSTAIFPDTSNYGYKVSPFILGNSPPTGVGDSKQPPQASIQTFGPLKTAFTADPIDSQLGGAWWSLKAAYAAAPDVALNHPNRLVLTEPALGNPIPPNCANTGGNASQMDCVDIADYYDQGTPAQPLNPWISNFLSMRGFFITSSDNPGAGPQLGYANTGDKLDLAVRVYNYSLAPVVGGTKTHVRFYAMPWDQLNNVQAGDSFLIGETVTDPIPAFSDAQGASLNWKLVHSPVPFDTTSYSGKWFAFWVVVWMEDGNGQLVKEMQGHGLTSIPGTLTNPFDAAMEMATNVDGKPASYSNNVGFYHYAFPVLPAVTGLGAAPSTVENPADLTMKTVTAARKSLKRGELDEITAVMRAGLESPSRAKVYFYDGDPAADGKLIATETARFAPRSTTKVRIAYHPPTDGVHRIYAVVNKGKDSQIERHTAPILVGDVMADGNNSDGDEPPIN